MNNQQILDNALKLIKQEKKFSGHGLEIQSLAGDASLRHYLRVSASGEKRILMLVEPFTEANYNFLLVRSCLEKNGVPVPRLHLADGAHGAILLEDLSDRTMLHALGESDSEQAELSEFGKAIDLLALFHARVQPQKEKAQIEGFQLAFDEEKLMWEVDFAIEHLQLYLQRPLAARDLQVIREGFVDICRRLANEPRVFTHRDYHSRNIMIPASGAYTCIDFQDARMGLRQYDLASILRDSYYQLDAAKVYQMVDHYLAAVKKLEQKNIDRDAFIEVFDLMSIQRNFKAIGSFTMFCVKRGNVSYIRFVGNTFENIRKNLLKFPEYSDLRKTLFQYYYF